MNRFIQLISNRSIVFAGLLIAMNLTVFWQVRNFEFLNYDDEGFVVQNPHLRAGLTAEGITWAFSAGLLYFSGNTDYWQPVTFLSRMLDIQFFGLHPAMHHLVNVALHLLNTLLLFHLLFRITGRLERSFWVSALFAIHPLHVESVAWVVERKDVLYALFWFLAMETWLDYVAGPNHKSYLKTLFLFGCSLMSKPMAVTFPLVLMLLDYWPLRCLSGFGCLSGAKPRPWDRLFLEKIPFLLLSLAVGWITLRSRFVHARPPSFLIALSNGFVSYSTYLIQTAWPVHLAIHYPPSSEDQGFVRIASAAFLILLISIWAFRRARELPHRPVGWCWFLVTLTPVITLNDIAGADRFTYLPLIGVFLMGIWEVAEWGRWNSSLRAPLRVAGGVVLAGFMGTSWVQVGYWQNSEKVTRHLMQVVPHDWVGHDQMGMILLNRGENHSAESEFRMALALKPNESYLGYVYDNLGNSLLGQGKNREAIQSFENALQHNPVYYGAEFNIGEAWLNLNDLHEAARHYFRSIQIHPDQGPAHHHLALCLAASGYLMQAENHFRTAYQLQSDSPAAQRQIIADMEWIRSQVIAHSRKHKD